LFLGTRFSNLYTAVDVYTAVERHKSMIAGGRAGDRRVFVVVASVASRKSRKNWKRDREEEVVLAAGRR
jgi:hypothetical protein